MNEQIKPEAKPKLTGAFRFWKMALIEGSKGLLFLGLIGAGGFGLWHTQWHPALRLVSGLILMCGALGGFFWPQEFSKYIVWFELDDEDFKFRRFRQRRKQKVAAKGLRARSRSSRGVRYACTISVGDFEEVVVIFDYLTNGRELFERLQGVMVERSADD